MNFLLRLSKYRVLITGLILGVVALLNGCAIRPVTTQSDNVQSNLSVLHSDLTLDDLKSWCLSGRSVARNNESGWQAAVRWCVEDDMLTLDISGPININRIFLRYLNGELWMQESSSEITISHSPQRLLQSRLGFSVPLSAIRYWLLGIAEPGPAAHVRVNEGGNNEQISQLDWIVKYSEYQAVKQFMLPRKINIKKDQIRLKIVVDEWELNR